MIEECRAVPTLRRRRGDQMARRFVAVKAPTAPRIPHGELSNDPVADERLWAGNYKGNSG